ncbi:hypothetical protein [Faecalispora anaeroviscerum]|uniref:hypothetical protein n=1 Tax=Faecalispora anaeroviscerum TaxID=2991836 RepID=UPI0024BAA14D|nr:hypothetical protein [Faecalispora anaeroviscerum]
MYTKLQNDHERLRKVISLCGIPKTPQQLFIAATACSWLGGNDELTAKYAQQYLETPGWDLLSSGTMVEEGITISRWARSRAEMYVLLAQAQENLGKHEAALTNFAEAYRLEPYDAMYAVKMAGIIETARSRKEALQFLKQQTLTSYYRPLHYKDEYGHHGSNQTFRQIIDSHILRLESLEK